jgi:3-oxoacyl-[acyl-carrier-protein] synthase III
MAGFTQFVDLPIGTTVTNYELPMTFENVSERTCIRTRQIAISLETITSIARKALEELFRNLDILPQDCEGLVLASCTAVAGKNGATMDAARCLADSLGIQYYQGVDYACSGFPAATAKALEMLPADSKGHIAIVCAEILSRYVDWSRESEAILFGDGVAATTVTNTGPNEILYADVHEVEDLQHLINLEEDEIMRFDGKSERGTRIVMNGKPLYRNVPEAMLRLIGEAIDRTNTSIPAQNRVDIVHHQANGKFAEKIQKLVLRDQRFSHAVVHNEIGERGNIGAASIPSALARSWEQVPDGSIIASPAKGAGSNFAPGKLTEGVVLFRKGAVERK